MATAMRFPEIRDQLNINNGLFGTYLTLGGIGWLLAFIYVGDIVHKFGIRPVIIVASTGLFGTMAAVPHIMNPQIWLASNILIGFFWVSFHVSNNGQAIHRQEEIGELILTRLHGLWSLGALVTSIGAIIVTPFVSLAWHIDVLMFLVWVATIHGIRKSTPYFIDKADEGSELPKITLKSIVTSFRAQPAVALTMILAMQIEFSTQDWSAIYLRDSIGMSDASSIYGYTVFIGAMIIFRFNANRLHHMFSEAVLLKWPPIVGAIGFITFIPLGTLVSEFNLMLGFSLALFGYALAGFGSSLLAPTLFGIAFRISKHPSSVVVAQLCLVAAVVAFFVKILISWVAEATSVTLALMIPALMLLATSKFSYLGSKQRD